MPWSYFGSTAEDSKRNCWPDGSFITKFVPDAEEKTHDNGGLSVPNEQCRKDDVYDCVERKGLGQQRKPYPAGDAKNAWVHTGHCDWKGLAFR
jgi:hypothetical protein